MHAMLDPRIGVCRWCRRERTQSELCRLPRYDAARGEFRTECVCARCMADAFGRWCEELAEHDIAPVMREWNAWCHRQGILFLEVSSRSHLEAALRLIGAAGGI